MLNSEEVARRELRFTRGTPRVIPEGVDGKQFFQELTEASALLRVPVDEYEYWEIKRISHGLYTVQWFLDRACYCDCPKCGPDWSVFTFRVPTEAERSLAAELEKVFPRA